MFSKQDRKNDLNGRSKTEQNEFIGPGSYNAKSTLTTKIEKARTRRNLRIERKKTKNTYLNDRIKGITLSHHRNQRKSSTIVQ